MAEWSKALDLSSSILRMHEFEPRRRHSFSMPCAAQHVTQAFTQSVSFDGLVGYDDRLTRGRCRVRSSVEVPFEDWSSHRALVAQLAALRSYEPMVQGSSPCRSSFVRATLQR